MKLHKKVMCKPRLCKILQNGQIWSRPRKTSTYCCVQFIVFDENSVFVKAKCIICNQNQDKSLLMCLAHVLPEFFSKEWLLSADDTIIDYTPPLKKSKSAQPFTGKTIIMQKIANAITANNPETSAFLSVELAWQQWHLKHVVFH